MSDQDIFRKMDEEEREYAPQELPADQQQRVAADEGTPNTMGAIPVPFPVNGAIGGAGAVLDEEGGSTTSVAGLPVERNDTDPDLAGSDR